MTNSNNDNNDNFFDFFKERLNFVNINCLERIEGIILLCSYIDSLAGYTYGGNSSYIRFKKFLIECTTQSNTWKKVSLILLRQYTESRDFKYYDDLINLLNRLGARTSDFINLDNNPDIHTEELLSECKAKIHTDKYNLILKDIEKFDYTAILWNAYRNASVHESAIQLEQAMNIKNHEIPYYSNLNKFINGKLEPQQTCFGIPPIFLIRTIESGLESIREKVDNGHLKLQLSNLYTEQS